MAKYIQDQLPYHTYHKKQSFREEFVNLLRRDDIAFDAAHLWD